MPVFITPFWTLHNEQRKTKLYFFKKPDSILKPTCLGLNETGMPHQLSCRHFFWQLQDTLFTPVVECSTEGHLSFFLSFFLSQFFFFFFCEIESRNRKYFYCSKSDLSGNITKMSYLFQWKAAEQAGHMRYVLKNLRWKKDGCFNLKGKKIQLHWACHVKPNSKYWENILDKST